MGEGGEGGEGGGREDRKGFGLQPSWIIRQDKLTRARTAEANVRTKNIM